MTVGPSGKRHGVLNVLKAAVYALLVVFLCWQVWRVRDGLGSSMGSVGWKAAALATACVVVGQFPGFFGWRLLVAGSGIRLTLSDAAWVYFASGASRYLPGAIWPAVMQAALAKRVGAPAAKFMTIALVGVALTATSGGVVGLLALPRLLAHDPTWWLMVPVLLFSGAVMLAPRLLGRLLGLGQRVLRRGDGEITLPDRRASLGMIALSILGWCCNGVQAAILAAALGAPLASAMTLGVGGFALSSVAGSLALTPAGIGVREVVLGLTLGVLISGPDLVTLLLLSRVLTTLGHVLATLGVLGVLAAKRVRRKRRREKQAPDVLSAH